MSAAANIVFFGIKINLPPEQIGSGGLRKHPLHVRARELKLDIYYSNCGGIDPQYFLLIGKIIGVTGPENKTQVEMSAPDLLQVMNQIREKLQVGKFEGEAKLHTLWIPDT